jgi:membrane associated rhomboid family serine protease
MLKPCLFCKNPLFDQKVFQHGIKVCYQCYWVGFTQTTLEWITAGPFSEQVRRVIERNPPRNGLPCLICNQLTETIPIQLTQERKENLKLFPNFKMWDDHYKRGELKIYYCPACIYSYMNSRTLCQLPIDWFGLEAKYRELLRVEELEESSIENNTSPLDDPLGFLARTFFELPRIDNIPSLPHTPFLTYLVTAGVCLVTFLAFQDPLLRHWLILDPSTTGITLWRSMLTCSWIHQNWLHFFGNMIPFVAFAPFVEYEMSTEAFLLLLGSSAFAGALLQTIILPSYLLGFSGSVSAVLAFFCCRFPTAVIGMGIYQFAAPTVLAIYVMMDLKSGLDLLQQQGNIAGFAHLAGSFVGFIFHLSTLPGKSSAEFKTMALDRLKKEKDVRDWNK